MFKFGNEGQLTDFIIKHKGDFEEFKDKKIIGGEVCYGHYFDKKDNIKRGKQSDLVMIDEKTISFVEIRCGYITPELVSRSKQAISWKDFHKRIEVIFMGTKISRKTKEYINKFNNLRYIPIENVQYIKGYKLNTDISKYGYFKNVEIYAYKILNYGFNVQSYDIKKYFINEDKLKFECRFYNGYGIDISISYLEEEGRFFLEYEIIKMNKNNIDVLAIISHLRHNPISYIELSNIYNLVKRSDRNFLNKQNIDDILKAIHYLNHQQKRR